MTETLGLAPDFTSAANSLIGVAALINPAFVDVASAATFLAISESAVRNEIRTGRITAKRYGKKPIIAVTELQRYAETLPDWTPREVG